MRKINSSLVLWAALAAGAFLPVEAAFAAGPELAAPVPVGSPGDWILASDFPADTVGEGFDGATGFELSVDAEGAVTACRVTASSGVQALDDLTCRLIGERARFTPATNVRGRPRPGTYANRVRWVAPKPEPQLIPSPGALVISYIVEKDGTKSSCEIVRAAGYAAATAEPGPIPCDSTKFTAPYVNLQGQPVRKRVLIIQGIDVVDVTP